MQTVCKAPGPHQLPETMRSARWPALGRFCCICFGRLDGCGHTGGGGGPVLLSVLAALYAASAIYHYYPGTAASGRVKRCTEKWTTV